VRYQEINVISTSKNNEEQVLTHSYRQRTTFFLSAVKFQNFALHTCIWRNLGKTFVSFWMCRSVVCTSCTYTSHS